MRLFRIESNTEGAPCPGRWHLYDLHLGLSLRRDRQQDMGTTYLPYGVRQYYWRLDILRPLALTILLVLVKH